MQHRETIQLRMTLNALKKLMNHPTAEEVYNEVQKEHQNISKATVYRNLQKLTDDGEALSIEMPGMAGRYDHQTYKHYHFICRNCGKVYDVKMNYFDQLNEEAQSNTNLKIEEHNITFKGICENCNKGE